MSKKKTGVAFILLLTCVLGGQALAQGSEVKFNSNADDLAKIGGVLEEFHQDIIRKDSHNLTKLMLNPSVLFHSLDDQEYVDRVRKYNSQFDGIDPSVLDGFCEIPDYNEEQTRREVSQNLDLSFSECAASD